MMLLQLGNFYDPLMSKDISLIFEAVFFPLNFTFEFSKICNISSVLSSAN